MSTGFQLIFICTLISHRGLCQRCLIKWENAAKIIQDYPSPLFRVIVNEIFSTDGSKKLFFTCENQSIKITNIFPSEPTENSDVIRKKVNFFTSISKKFKNNKISQKKNSLCTVSFNFPSSSSSSSSSSKEIIYHLIIRNTSDEIKLEFFVESNCNNSRRRRSNDRKNHFPSARPLHESSDEEKSSVSTLADTAEPSRPSICTICDCTDEKLIIIILAILLAAETTGLITAIAVKLLLKYRQRPKPVAVDRTNGFDVRPNGEMYEIPRPSIDERSSVDSYRRRSQSFNDSIEEEIEVARL